MQPHTHKLNHLFEQLGLPSDEKDIDAFLAKHHLKDDEKLHSAWFLSDNQRRFVQEGWKQDSDWCEPIDLLDVLLRSPH